MAFNLSLDAKLVLINTLAGIIGGVLSFYSDRGLLNLGTAVSLAIGTLVFLLAAYAEQKIFQENDFKWYINQGAFVYILVWLVVNGVLTTF